MLKSRRWVQQKEPSHLPPNIFFEKNLLFKYKEGNLDVRDIHPTVLELNKIVLKDSDEH